MTSPKPAKKRPAKKSRAKKKRPTKWQGLGSPESLYLEHACYFISEALGETTYLVGSATEKRDFRDVDVRVIFSDEKFAALFGPDAAPGCRLSPFWSLLCASISTYLSKVTDLPVDFQIQQRSSISEADWSRYRDPLGRYPSYAGRERPAWHVTVTNQ